MNEMLDILMNRRSIRSYKPEQIKEEELDTILRAGIHAPSAMNQQSWHITVIQNRDMINRINETCRQLFLNSGNDAFKQRAANPDFNLFYNAPTLVIISGDEKAIAPQVDCALAGENMLLAAASLGVGSCWIGVAEFLFGTEAGKKLKGELGIPEGYKPFYSLIFGYNAGDAPEAAARKENNINYIR